MQRTILVVDDSDFIRNVYRVVFENVGYTVLEAVNGSDAVLQVRAERPHVVLLDFEMPVMDGLEAAELLKADPRTADIPILLISANVEADLPARALTLGCVTFLQKPVPMREILRKVEQALVLAERACGR